MISINSVLAVVEAADSAHSLEELPELLLPALCRTVGADSAGWAELVNSRPVRYASHPGYLIDRGTAHEFERHIPDFPLARHTRPGGAGFPLRRSDLQSRHSYHHSEMYAEVMRHLGIEEILAMSLTDQSRHLHICISLHRSGTDFHPATVETLGHLRPFLSRRASRLHTSRTQLTDRQTEVLTLVARGMTDAAIARQLGCSARTVDKHLEHAYRRLGVSSRAAAVASCLSAPAPARPPAPVEWRVMR